jgi:hypothetical protein
MEQTRDLHEIGGIGVAARKKPDSGLSVVRVNGRLLA